MTVTLSQIWRHPIKSHGRERLDRVALVEGQTMPWDRRWAVAHDASSANGTEWALCANFSRGSKVAALMAINASCGETTGRITLTHPDRAPLTFDPDRDTAIFLDWVRPLMPADRAQSARIVRVPGRGMTDTPYPSVSLINLNSHNAVGRRLGQDLSPLRWRANFWIDGLADWKEFDWVGRTLRIGEAELRVEAPIIRCLATSANPETGRRDADTLGALDWGPGDREFGIYAVVTRSGEVATGDTVAVL